MIEGYLSAKKGIFQPRVIELAFLGPWDLAGHIRARDMRKQIRISQRKFGFIKFNPIVSQVRIVWLKRCEMLNTYPGFLAVSYQREQWRQRLL